MEEKRICVHGLPELTTESEISSLFSTYGSVTNIYILKRKKQGGTSCVFVTLKANPADINDCIHSLNNSSYRGSFLKVEPARVNFLDRLQKEREEQQLKARNTPTVTVKPEVPQLNVDQACSINDIKVRPQTPKESNRKKLKEPAESRKVNQEKLKTLETSRKEQKKSCDNLRLAALNVQHSLYLERKSAVSLALKAVDSSVLTNKKIVFNDDEEAEVVYDDEQTQTKVVEKSRDLFDDKDSSVEESEMLNSAQTDGSEHFNLKPQFEGTAGRKLFELQSRFNNDPRFKLDERFRDEEELNNLRDNVNEEDPNLEKEKSLSILEDVLGHKVTTSSPTKKSPKYNYVIDMSRMRFDPKQSTADEFLIKRPKVNSNKAEQLQSGNNKGVSEEKSVAAVSKERFYAVSENLKEAFSSKDVSNGGNSFSFLKAFAPNEAENASSSNANSDIHYDKFFENNHAAFKQRNDITRSPRNSSQQFTNANNQPFIDRLSQASFFQDQSMLQEGLNFFSKKSESAQNQQSWKEKKDSLKKYLVIKRRRNLKRNPLYAKKKQTSNK